MWFTYFVTVPKVEHTMHHVEQSSVFFVVGRAFQDLRCRIQDSGDNAASQLLDGALLLGTKADLASADPFKFGLANSL
jgi:hypothetical protein